MLDAYDQPCLRRFHAHISSDSWELSDYRHGLVGLGMQD